ncbi:DNA-directed RNA polymerases II, IV and V subunit 3-like [Pyrus ussuriensis x Pyrus communis]|uniref:DNA-directed RNA polymerases II, IV and V subunit 3-like n=1 Tax=Pyrus ussuriensis x Pyrus communis TaxID=2448454 RepID=A0A5N5I3J0_9ROSA|nr:DNA-directed RNA polymerases II, IV and V subunit 3-like [Pyrus ussuriensis x Pyrus communis]
MTPKVARIQSYRETGEGISTMHHLLNGLHHPWVGLHTSLLFEKGGVHSLGPTWTSIALKSIIFPCTDIHKPRLLHSLCLLDHFIIIGVCFGINYHVTNFGRTYGGMCCYGGNDYRGVI